MQERLALLKMQLDDCHTCRKVQEINTGMMELERKTIEDEIASIKLTAWNEAHDSNIQIGDEIIVTQEIFDLCHVGASYRITAPFEVGAVALIISIDHEGESAHLRNQSVLCSTPLELILRSTKAAQWGAGRENNS